MPDMARGRAWMVALALIVASPAHAWMGEDIRQLHAGLQSVADRAATLKGPAAPISALMAEAGMAPAPAPMPAALTPAAAPEYRSMNMRIALTMLSLGYGTQDNAVVLMAQPQVDQKALAVTAGRATLASLSAALIAEGLTPDDAAPGLRLQVPLIVMPGAELALAPGETLVLDREAGAFVANFGRISVQGGTIATTEAPNARMRSFVPFVATAQGGSVQLDGARIAGLGFGRTTKFAGFGVLLSALRMDGQDVAITGTVFDGLRGVTLTGVDDARVQGNLFTAMRGPALTVNRGARAVVAGNLFVAPMATNAIVIDHGALAARVEGNLVLGGDRAGIVVRNDSDGAMVTGNTVWRRGGGGITVATSDCGVVTGNLVLGNDQKGVEIRSSDGSRVAANRIFGNGSMGLWVSAQEAGALVRFEDNVLSENGTGLASASGAEIWLSGNDFSMQYLRFFGGDLAQQSHLMAMNMTGTVPVMLTAAGGVHQESQPPDRCDGS